MFYFSTYCPSSLKHLSYLSADFWMPDAKNDAGCCPCHSRTTDCTSVSDTNFCPPRIFLHQMWTLRFVKHLSPYIRCISEWIWLAFMFWPTQKTIMAQCSLRDDFSGNVAVFNVYNKNPSYYSESNSPQNVYFGFLMFEKTSRMTLFRNLFIKPPS